MLGSSGALKMDNFLQERLLIILLVLWVYQRNNAVGGFSAKDIIPRLARQEVSSFYSCQAIVRNITAQMRKNQPVPNVPRRNITDKDVTFELYTRQNYKTPYPVKSTDNGASLKKSPFDSNKLIFLWMHGYAESIIKITRRKLFQLIMLVYFLITLICVHGSQIVEACRHCNRPRHRDEPNINLPDGVGVADQQWCKAEKESVLENHTALSDNKIEPKDVIFMFYARNDQRSPVKVRIINDTLYPEPVTFNSSKHTVLFLPAEQKSYSDVAGKLREGLANLDVNLIVVNWDKHAYDSPEYTRYITIPRLGNIVSDFTKIMIEEKKSDPKTMYFIGSGLGGQAIGVAGHKLLPNAVARMLAIDPIDSCYGYENPDKRLSIGDANHIATMYCTLGSRGTSLDFIRGDATFFINGGKVQPSCTTFAHGSAHQINGCSRNLCENYFFESLQDGKLFAGAKCSSYEQYETSPKKCDFRRSECMGFFSQRKADGLYFVDITDRRSRVQKHVPKCRTYCDFSWF